VAKADGFYSVFGRLAELMKHKTPLDVERYTATIPDWPSLVEGSIHSIFTSPIDGGMSSLNHESAD